MTDAAPPQFDASPIARMIAHGLKLQEKDLPVLLHGTGLPPQVLLASSPVSMSNDQLKQVFQNAQGLGHRRKDGFGLIPDLELASYGPIGLLLRNAPNLFTALKAPLEFAPLRTPFAETVLTFQDDWLHCTFQIYMSVDERSRQSFMESFSLTMQAYAERVLGRTLTEGLFYFDYPEPLYADDYALHFHSPVKFGANTCTMLIPAELAQQPNANQDPMLYALAQQQCREMIEKIPTTSLLTSDRVRAHLISNASGGVSEVEIAQALFISKRTLARRLADEGTTYREIRERLFSDLAGRYLKDKHVSVEAIAASLGYHDAANFRRAFRRWFSISPQEFRRRLGL